MYKISDSDLRRTIELTENALTEDDLTIKKDKLVACATHCTNMGLEGMSLVCSSQLSAAPSESIKQHKQMMEDWDAKMLSFKKFMTDDEVMMRIKAMLYMLEEAGEVEALLAIKTLIDALPAASKESAFIDWVQGKKALQHPNDYSTVS
tara:strand:+ start:638 stop:1084 length:447 start_codon:yes stop_codon:yes gene_type:complete